MATPISGLPSYRYDFYIKSIRLRIIIQVRKIPRSVANFPNLNKNYSAIWYEHRKRREIAGNYRRVCDIIWPDSYTWKRSRTKRKTRVENILFIELVILRIRSVGSLGLLHLRKVYLIIYPKIFSHDFACDDRQSVGAVRQEASRWCEMAMERERNERITRREKYKGRQESHVSRVDRWLEWFFQLPCAWPSVPFT